MSLNPIIEAMIKKGVEQSAAEVHNLRSYDNLCDDVYHTLIKINQRMDIIERFYYYIIGILGVVFINFIAFISNFFLSKSSRRRHDPTQQPVNHVFDSLESSNNR